MNEQSRTDHRGDDPGRPVSDGREPEDEEPTPGSDGDGAESGYTSPAELAAHQKLPAEPRGEADDGA